MIGRDFKCSLHPCLCPLSFFVFALCASRGAGGVHRPPLLHKDTWGHFTQCYSVIIIIIDIIVSNTLVIIMMIIIMATATDSFYFLIKFLLPHQCDAPLNIIITSDQTYHPVQHNHPQSAANAPLDTEDPQWTLGSDLHNNSSINNYKRSAVFRMGKLNCLKSTNHLNLCF